MIIFGYHLTKKKFLISTICTVIFLIIAKSVDTGEDFHGPEFPKNLVIDDVRHLLLAADKANIDVILFDPVVLQAWDRNYDKTLNHIEECIFICHAVGLLHFVILNTEFENKALFLTTLAEHDFTITQFYNDKRELGHILIQREGAAFHIAVLHWKDSGYWHQSSMDGSAHELAIAKKFITMNSLNVINVDRAYERFDTKMITIDSLSIFAPSDIELFAKDFQFAHFIPCNLKQAEEFNTRFPSEENHQAIRFRHMSWKLLSKAKALLDQLFIPFWLSSGTCLGYFRQCDIIPWAKDVDLGVFINDYNSSIVKEFEKRGLRLIHKFGKQKDSLELSFIDTEGDVKLDIFFFYTEGKTMWNGGTQAKTGKKYKYVFPRFKMCWTEFLRIKVRIPCQIEDYIKANYGNGWNRPNKNWDWKSSPPNVVENGVWPIEERSQVIQIL